jgi:hypothetical protein
MNQHTVFPRVKKKAVSAPSTHGLFLQMLKAEGRTNPEVKVIKAPLA